MILKLEMTESLRLVKKNKQNKTSTMKETIEYRVVDWASIPKTEHIGEQGVAYWQSLQFGDLRVRIV